MSVSELKNTKKKNYPKSANRSQGSKPRKGLSFNRTQSSYKSHSETDIVALKEANKQ